MSFVMVKFGEKERRNQGLDAKIHCYPASSAEAEANGKLLNGINKRCYVTVIYYDKRLKSFFRL